MSYKIILLLFSFSFFTPGCLVIKFEGPLKLNESYNRYKTEGEFPVVFKSNIECQDTFKDTIYAVNARNLKQCLSPYKESMVYMWSPHCSSDKCYSIAAVQEYADRQGYELFVVMEKYDHEKLSVQRMPKRPIYSIDHNFYDKELKFDRYREKFIEELTGEKNIVASYLFFLNGKLSRYSLNIDLSK